jgi:RNA polymerase sigma-70 factor (ECF subfamily)
METTELVARAQQGDEAALTALYHEHRTHVYRRCNQMLRNPADAEDLTQETFLKLHLKIGSFRGDSSFSTWLYRMATNEVLMHLRGKQAETVSLEDMEREPADTRHDSDHGVSAALENLPQQLREVAVMRLREGYSTDETSKALHIHPMAVVRRLTKVKAVLRKQFAPIPRMAHS